MIPSFIIQIDSMRPVIWTKRFYPLGDRKNFQTKASQAQFHTHAFQVLFLTISLSFAKSFLKLKKRLLSISNLLPTNLVTTCGKEVYEN